MTIGQFAESEFDSTSAGAKMLAAYAKYVAEPMGYKVITQYLVYCALMLFRELTDK